MPTNAVNKYKSSFTDTAMFVTGKTLGQRFLLAIFGIVLYLCFRIMQPFLMPIVLALILWLANS